MGGKRKSRMAEPSEAGNPMNGDINQKFREFVNEIFNSSNESIMQSASILQFCKEFGMDRDHLINLKDFDERQEYLFNCINKQIEN